VRRVTPSSRFCNYSTAAITTNEEVESGWRNRRYFASRSVILPTPVQLQITIMWNGESSRLSKFVHRDFSSFLSSSVQFHFYDFFSDSIECVWRSISSTISSHKNSKMSEAIFGPSWT
jgi:hypothetical protein